MSRKYCVGMCRDDTKRLLLIKQKREAASFPMRITSAPRDASSVTALMQEEVLTHEGKQEKVETALGSFGNTFH